MDKPSGTPDCCQGVDGPCENTPTWRKQNTAYTDEIKNWINACDECFTCIDLEWETMWREAIGPV